MYNPLKTEKIMKKMLIVAMMMTIAISASAITRNEARLMTDRMAYELRLDKRQYSEVYHINLHYAPGTAHKTHAMARVLSPRQFDKYMTMKRHAHVAPVAVRHGVHAPKVRHHAHRVAPARHHRVAARW